MKRIPISFLLLWLLSGVTMYSQSLPKISVDTLVFNDPPQRISLVTIPHTSKLLIPDMTTAEGNPMKTSVFGEKYQAIAAINGSFFDTRSFQMVTYYEESDSIFSHNAISKKPTLFTGIIIIDQKDSLFIERFKGEDVYQASRQEKKALAAGPVLLLNGERSVLPDRPAFTLKKHPRSCLCITDEAVVLIAVDGRSEQAVGMTLPELQEFLLDLSCRDAINLDGGGSTSLWTMSNGMINQPSDTAGERKVVNAIIWRSNQQ